MWTLCVTPFKVWAGWWARQRAEEGGRSTGQWARARGWALRFHRPQVRKAKEL